MLLKGSVVAAFICCTYAAISRGPCKDAKKGGKYETCEMDCDWDGSCYEVVRLETCDCRNAAVYTSTQYNFKVRFENFQNLTIQFPFHKNDRTSTILLFKFIHQ